jgi:hypothetical protein
MREPKPGFSPNALRSLIVIAVVAVSILYLLWVYL